MAFKNKKVISFSLLTLVLFVYPNFAFAQDLSTESIPQYIKSLYTVGLMLVGVSALLMLVYCGYLYMIGGVNASAITKAKECIFNALTGLVLLIAAVLILRTINPQLIELKWDGIRLNERQEGILEEIIARNKAELKEEEKKENPYSHSSSQAKCEAFCEGGKCRSDSAETNWVCENLPEYAACAGWSQCFSKFCFSEDNTCRFLDPADIIMDCGTDTIGGSLCANGRGICAYNSKGEFKCEKRSIL